MGFTESKKSHSILHDFSCYQPHQIPVKSKSQDSTNAKIGQIAKWITLSLV